MPPSPTTALLAADRAGLVVDWCSHQAAAYAVRRWHYSRRLPGGKLVRVGVWEDGDFIGAVVFGSGASPSLGAPYGLPQIEVCELVRVALRQHRAPVTQIVAIALRMLRRQSPGIRLVVSFADTARGHHGGIYQAGNWLYLGAKADPAGAYLINGTVYHQWTMYSRYGRVGRSIPWLREHVDPEARRIRTPPKHKYVMPLDRGMRRRILSLCKPYPAPEA